jgi:type VI protein secretion system component VasF
MNNLNEIEKQLLDAAPTLPPHVRNRVLNRCAAQRQQEHTKRRRANWRLAWGFAAVCALHWFVGGALDAQRQALLGTSNAPHAMLQRDMSPSGSST